MADRAALKTALRRRIGTEPGPFYRQRSVQTDSMKRAPRVIDSLEAEPFHGKQGGTRPQYGGAALTSRRDLDRRYGRALRRLSGLG